MSGEWLFYRHLKIIKNNKRKQSTTRENKERKENTLVGGAGGGGRGVEADGRRVDVCQQEATAQHQQAYHGALASRRGTMN